MSDQPNAKTPFGAGVWDVFGSEWERLMSEEPPDDTKTVEALGRSLMAAHPARVLQYRADALQLKFFVKEIMTASRGSINPNLVTTVMKRLLEESNG